MAAEQVERTGESPRPGIDWEAFYRNYRKPGYVPGFEIVNKLGGGVFGMVFKARKESIGKDYAIKFLKVDDEVVRDAVVRELDSVRFFAQVDHPNLVSIEDKGEVDGIPYIVMNYAGQGTLRRRLEGGKMDREEALRIFVQAARGVQALHVSCRPSHPQMPNLPYRLGHQILGVFMSLRKDMEVFREFPL